MTRATELEFFKWFYFNADFGPADSDVRDILANKFMTTEKKNLPEGYNYASDGETVIDMYQEDQMDIHDFIPNWATHIICDGKGKAWWYIGVEDVMDKAKKALVEYKDDVSKDLETILYNYGFAQKNEWFKCDEDACILEVKK